jgi:hypothetical protein
MSDTVVSEEKFNTCVYRSLEPEVHHIALCCGERKTVDGFVCTLLKLCDIKPETCNSCRFYSDSLNILS